MGRGLRIVTRSILLALPLGLTGAASPPPAPARPESAVAVYREVRIRKLHLVRPDLIPYPLMYEVVC